QVAKHDSQEDIYIIISSKGEVLPRVYDITKYLDDHPGGAEVLLEVAGQDATDMFEDIGHSQDARETMKKYEVGVLKV
ncbi:unnamed protein product, partial [Chrysoparadoxa australica]